LLVIRAAVWSASAAAHAASAARPGSRRAQYRMCSGGVRRLPSGMPVDQFPLPRGQAIGGEAPRPCLDTWQVADGPFRAAGTQFPAAAKLGQGEVGGKLPAVPDHPAVAVLVVRQADGIAGHLAGVLGAVSPAD
jgi:hypothetical protein